MRFLKIALGMVVFISVNLLVCKKLDNRHQRGKEAGNTNNDSNDLTNAVVSLLQVNTVFLYLIWLEIV